MRIAIPVTGNSLEPHFGHCERFLFVDVAPGTRRITNTAEEPAPEHQPGLLPPWLKERGVTHVLAGNMGAHARTLLAQLSVEVITGAPTGLPLDIVGKYLSRTLETVEYTCHH